MVSNKTLAVLIVTAVVISLGGTIISLNKLDTLKPFYAGGTPGLEESTGFATGIVNLSITGVGACAVVTNVSFGASGAPTSGPPNVSTDTTNVGNGMTFNDCSTGVTCSGLTVNNTGNTNLTVDMVSSANASTLLAMSQANSYFVQYVRNGSYANAGQGCYTPGNFSLQEVNETSRRLCYKLVTPAWSPTNTMLTLEYNVTIPQTIPQGEHRATITITCADSGD